MGGGGWGHLQEGLQQLQQAPWCTEAKLGSGTGKGRGLG